ncbi:MAG: ABC transporter substrate-binding protein [Chloroflexi bacterium]|nr:ABC transporter substrate-binding protein [Chloroflexota bacterium]
MRIAVPDLISNSYFPAVAAVELGFFKAEGLDAELQMLSPIPKAMEALRDDQVDFVAGPAHAALSAFPEWKGVKLAAALAQQTFWLLILRSDLGATPGDVNAVKGLRIGAAPGPEAALRRLLIEAGIDFERDQVQLGPVPGAAGHGVSFGVHAAKALEEGVIDGFWANAMGSEVAVRSGAGVVILDVRRGMGPASAQNYTFAALVTSDNKIEKTPDDVAAAVRAIVKVQNALRADPSIATAVGERLFPPEEAGFLASLVERDLPFYDPSISEEVVEGLNRFALDTGILSAQVPYEQVVATQFSGLWAQ